MAYHIQLPQFEGPLELLLKLIEKQKLDITRVSLAKVTDQYLESIASNKQVSLENLSWFLVIASRLILMKSKALLPILSFHDDEEEAMDDLEYQLKEYKKFKDAAMKIGGMFGAAFRLYSREPAVLDRRSGFVPTGMTPKDVRMHFVQVLQDIPILEKLEERMMMEVITLEEKITSLQETLRRRMHMSFSEIMEQSSDRNDVIVSFLAMLELVKQRIIHVEQGSLFADITLRTQQKNN